MTSDLYKLHILGERGDLSDQIEAAFAKQIRDLGLPSNTLEIKHTIEIGDFRNAVPAFCVHVGRRLSLADEASVDLANSYNVPLVPVVLKSTHLDGLPEPLRKYNGMVVANENGISGLVSCGLEWLGLLSRQRKAFISYKRKDARKAALALHERLVMQGYDVFLDTHDVRPAEDFQAVLMHRLCDSDIVILFDTPNFMKSRWTKEELARACLLNIALVQVVWPGHIAIETGVLAERIYLANDQLRIDKGLRADASKRIVATVEELRSRAFAFRTSGIVGEFVREAETSGFDVVLERRDHLVATRDDGAKIVAVPITGIPRSNDYHDVHDAIAETSYKNAIVLFQGTGMLERWSKHLTWLDGHLPVKAMTVEGVADYLRS